MQTLGPIRFEGFLLDKTLTLGTMKIGDIISDLEQWAPPFLQESYDNSGLIVGAKDWDTKGVLGALDCFEEVVDEAIDKDIRLIVTHHTIVFSGLKRFNGAN